MLFYENECRTMFCECSTVQNLGKEDNRNVKVQFKWVRLETFCQSYHIRSIKWITPISRAGADLSNVCLEKVTEKFPISLVKGEMKNNIEQSYQ